MEKILVTGGAGYLGAVLVGHLLRRGYQVTVVDSLIFGGESLLPYCTHPHFEFAGRKDIRDERAMKDLLAKHDVVFPLAAMVGQVLCETDPQSARSINYEAMVLLNRLRSKNQRVVWPCTNSGYGAHSGQVHCDETTPLEPKSLYGISKVNAEKELLSHPQSISLRLAAVFGPSPRMRLDVLVNNFVYKAVTEGYLVVYEKNYKRNFIHVEDVAECFVFCLDHFDQMKGEIYNVGLNEVLTKEELANKIKNYLPNLYVHFAEIGKDPDQRNYIVSNAKMNQKGFVAKRTVDEGIQQLIKAFEILNITH